MGFGVELLLVINSLSVDVNWFETCSKPGDTVNKSGSNVVLKYKVVALLVQYLWGLHAMLFKAMPVPLLVLRAGELQHL